MYKWQEFQCVENHKWRIYDISENDNDFIIGVYDEKDLTSSIHSHEFIQIYYIHEGMMQHEVEGQTDYLAKGDIFMIPPGIRHKSLPVEEKKVEYYSIGFMPDFVNFSPAGDTFLSEFLRFILLEYTVKSELHIKPRITFSDESFALASNLIKNMVMENEKKQPGYISCIKGQLLNLLALIAREYTTTQYYKKGKTTAKIYSDAILQSIEYIDQNFTKDLKIEDMTRKFLLSRTYFCELFKKFTGNTFNEYVNDLRINHAKMLLAISDMNITEVAIASGFNDISTFCRQFSRQINLPPSEYRKRINSRSSDQT